VMTADDVLRISFVPTDLQHGAPADIDRRSRRQRPARDAPDRLVGLSQYAVRFGLSPSGSRPPPRTPSGVSTLATRDSAATKLPMDILKPAMRIPPIVSARIGAS
jgi:hypothetical protein